MSPALPDRVIVVTGGFGALGRSLATVLAERGACLALLDRAPAPPGLAGDERTLLLGGIDGLVNVAGGFAWETLADGSLDTWDRLYAMNLRSAVAAAQAALAHLSSDGRGRIVNVGALAGLKSAAGMGAYAASKAGVLRFTEALAEELKERRITVNAVLPSIIDTPANRADMPTADFGRWVSPAALGRVIAFLLSDDAAAITGACLPVAGRV